MTKMQSERLQFEKAAAAAGIYTADFKVYDEAGAAHYNKCFGDISPASVGDYVSTALQSAWRVWQMGIAQQAALAAVLGSMVDELEQCSMVMTYLGAADAEDIDSDTFEILGEDEQGRNAYADVSIVEWAGRTAKLLSRLYAAQPVTYAKPADEAVADALKALSALLTSYERMKNGGRPDDAAERQARAMLTTA